MYFYSKLSNMIRNRRNNETKSQGFQTYEKRRQNPFDFIKIIKKVLGKSALIIKQTVKNKDCLK